MYSPTMDEITSPIGGLPKYQPVLPGSPTIDCLYSSQNFSSTGQTPKMSTLSISSASARLEVASELASGVVVGKRPCRKAKSVAMDRCLAQSYTSPKNLRGKRIAQLSISLPVEQNTCSMDPSMQPCEANKTNVDLDVTLPKACGLKRKCKPGVGKKLTKPVVVVVETLEVEDNCDGLISVNNEGTDEGSSVLTSTPKEVKARKKRILDSTLFDEDEPIPNIPTMCLHISSSAGEGNKDRANTEEDASYGSLSCSQQTFSPASSDLETDGEDLPDMLGTSVANDACVEKGDLIWFKYRFFPFWPAIVRFVYRVKKRVSKITVAFIGEINTGIGHQHLRVNYKKRSVFPFASCGHLQHNALKQEGQKSPYRKCFSSAVDEAEVYLYRKAQNDKINIYQYFASLFKSAVIHAATNTTQASKSATVDETLSLDQTLQPDNDDDYDNDAASDLSEASSTNGSEQQQPEEPQNSVSPAFTKATQQRIDKRTSKNQTLVDFVKQEACKTHLSDIFHSRISCKRHVLFSQSKRTKAEQNELKYSGYGPIADEAQWDEVITTVLDYSRVWVSRKDELRNVDYSLSVLAPEAIIFALQKVHNLSRNKAEKYFNRGARYYMEEKRQIERDFDRQTSADSPTPTSNSEDAEESDV